MDVSITKAPPHKSWAKNLIFCSAIVLISFFAPALEAQTALPGQLTQQAIAALPADHHDVYHAYFQYHVSWQNSAVIKARGKTATLNQLASDFAKFIHVDPKEIGIVSSVSGNTVDRLSVLSLARSSYIASHTDKQPPAHDLDQFEIRRQQIILSGVSELSKRLKPASWTGLHGYVNQDYRVRGSVLPIGAN